MKKIVSSITGCLLLFAQHASAQLIIGKESFVTGDNKSFVVLNDIGIENNAKTVKFENIFQFMGNGTVKISGLTDPTFHTIILSKSPGSKIILEKGISVEGSIQFKGGFIDLNNEIITLADTAVLMDESPLSRITGEKGGFIIITTKINTVTGNNPGNLGAVIDAQQDLGWVTIKRGHTSQSGKNMKYSLLRYFDIQPVNSSPVKASLRFHYFDEELNGQNENNLLLFESNDGGMSWNSEAVNLKDTSLNFSEKSGLNKLMRFTLASSGDKEEEKTKANAIIVTTTEQKMSGLDIWPNPAAGDFYVKTKTWIDNAVLRIFDVTGKLHKQISFDTGNQIKVTGLLPGVYIINVKGDDLDETGRVVVK